MSYMEIQEKIYFRLLSFSGFQLRFYDIPIYPYLTHMIAALNTVINDVQIRSSMKYLIYQLIIY